MNDLISWLRTQLDADERAVQAVGPRSWYFDMVEDAAQPFVDLALNESRVLRQVQAHRAILDLHSPRSDYQGRQVCEYCADLCHSRSGLGCDDPDAPYPCDTVRLLAGIYSDRDGYKEEWADVP